MDVIWWVVPIIGCVALAACVAAAMLPPRRDRPEALRALANTGRLTKLPEYLRAARLHTITVGVAAALLLCAFAATAFAAGRPTGLPGPGRDSAADEPEDIMVCVGGPATDPTVSGALRYFADAIPGYGTERIGLSSANRRLVPLTRDYQYAAGQFARSANQVLVAPVVYSDYTTSVEDTVAMCLAGFPDVDAASGERRSLIYIGPGTLAGDDGPRLFGPQQVRDLADRIGVQVNAVTDEASVPADLARETGGRVHPSGGDIAAQLGDIRAHPPAPRRAAENTAAPMTETPDALLMAALLAVIALMAWPLVVRR